MKRIYISSSVANFKEKLRNRYADYGEWTLLSLWAPTVFFGLYHPLDYLRFILHRGPKTVFWCGSDILNLAKSSWLPILRRITADHVCENSVEETLLRRLGFEPLIHPMFFDDPERFEITYMASTNPHVYLCAHTGRESEYGVGIVEYIAPYVPQITFHIFGVEGIDHHNIRYHGKVPTELFETIVKGCHAGIRLNSFDGFSEVIAKSILYGQYPISRIKYPRIDTAKDDATLIRLLKGLAGKRVPNPNRDFWKEQLQIRVEA